MQVVQQTRQELHHLLWPTASLPPYSFGRSRQKPTQIWGKGDTPPVYREATGHFAEEHVRWELLSHHLQKNAICRKN